MLYGTLFVRRAGCAGDAGGDAPCATLYSGGFCLLRGAGRAGSAGRAGGDALCAEGELCLPEVL